MAAAVVPDIKSLDVPERQVLLFFGGDPVPWHHRLLMERIEGSRWIVLTPTLDIEVTDLADAEDIRPVDRDASIPVICRPVFMFDAVDPAELQNLRWQCRQYADVLGVVLPAKALDPEVEWLFADTGHESFGKAVPPPMMAGGRALLRGAICLVQEDVNDNNSWTVAERVSKGDKATWMAEKRVGAGRDPRLNEGFPDSGDRLLLSEALTSMREAVKKGWSFKGPSAAKEVLEGIRATGMEPPAYCAHYLNTSGISPTSALGTEFKHLITILWMMVCSDRLDALNVSSTEYVCRRVLMIQRAVKRNPRSPDFDGLESFLSNALDSQGGIVTLEFEKFMADIQKSEAQVMKQQRMAREETEANEKRKKNGRDKGAGKGADGP